MRISNEGRNALKQLGMRCLVMQEHGGAFACEHMLKINPAGDGWMQRDGWNPHASCLSPGKLDNYCKDWKESLIDLNED